MCDVFNDIMASLDEALAHAHGEPTPGMIVHLPNAAPQPSTSEPARSRHAKAKRHHYIPLMIQRRFAGPDLHLWSFDKRNPQYGIERKPISRLFREWDLYTFVRPDGTRDRSSETRLSAIEGRAGLVLQRIVSEARDGRWCNLAEADRQALIPFVIAHLKRSPDFFNSVAPAPEMETDIALMFAKWEARFGPATELQRAELASGRLAARIRSNLMAQTAPEPMLRSSAVMLQRGLSGGIVGAPNRGFLLGSNPIARFLGTVSRRNGLGDPTAEAWIPVAHDLALCSFGNRDDEWLTEIDDAGLRKINGVIAAQSTVIASASRALVASFSRRHLRTLPKSKVLVGFNE